MIRDNELMKWYEQQWQVAYSQYFASDQPWLSTLRKQQLDNFLLQGFPTTRNENWKYTNLAVLKEKQISLLPQNEIVLPTNKVEKFYLPGPHHRLIFVDGRFNSALSQIHSLPNGVIVTNLKTALVNHSELLQTCLLQQQTKSSFSLLNLACLFDGAFIYIPASCSIELPIHILFISTQNSVNSMHNIRNIIMTDHHTTATLLEDYQSLETNDHLTNTVTQFFVGPHSQIEYAKLQYQNKTTFHFSNTEVLQKRDSSILSHYYGLGSQLARDDIHHYLAEDGATSRLQGMYLPTIKQHMDFHTYIYHNANHTNSEQLFKGVVAKQARGVFNGKIQVNKATKQIFANLQNHNLLLSEQAEVNTKPELEIYADDVKCTHGATVGQIDDEMMFYLRSRGIPKKEAYYLLLTAFINENLNAVQNELLKNKLSSYVKNFFKEELL